MRVLMYPNALALVVASSSVSRSLLETLLLAANSAVVVPVPGSALLGDAPELYQPLHGGASTGRVLAM